MIKVYKKFKQCNLLQIFCKFSLTIIAFFTDYACLLWPDHTSTLNEKNTIGQKVNVSH